MRNTLKTLAFLVIFTAISSCSSISEFITKNPVAADTAIRIAATQYISAGETPEAVEARAINVRDKVDQILEDMSENPELSLVALEEQFRQSINWQEMEIADQVLADALIVNVRLQLEKRVKDQAIPEDYSVALKTLLKIILNSTRLYGV